MFDINARMEQWSAANRVHSTEELTKSLQQPSEPTATEPISKSASIQARAAPFRKSKGPVFDIDSRVDAWNKSEKTGDSATYQNLSSSDPFKKGLEEPSDAVQMLSSMPPELVMDMVEMCLEKLENASEEPEPQEDAPKSEPSPKDDEPKDKDESESDEKPESDESDKPDTKEKDDKDAE